MKRRVRVIDLGLCEYEVAHRLQLATVEAIRNDSPNDSLFLLEHPEVYTFGRKSKENRLLVGEGNLVEVERGGEATYHNPGQLVAYPILKLEDEEKDIHLYLRRLEETLIRLLSRYGVECEAIPGATGVWTSKEKKKIASIGVAVRGWVTYHGIALNVENDLGGFARINPCGFSAGVMTSLKVLLGDKAPALSGVKTAFISSFSEIFGRHLLHEDESFC